LRGTQSAGKNEMIDFVENFKIEIPLALMVLPCNATLEILCYTGYDPVERCVPTIKVVLTLCKHKKL